MFYINALKSIHYDVLASVLKSLKSPVFHVYSLQQIEKIMNLIGAGIETSKNKQPIPSSGNPSVTNLNLESFLLHRFDFVV